MCFIFRVSIVFRSVIALKNGELFLLLIEDMRTFLQHKVGPNC